MSNELMVNYETSLGEQLQVTGDDVVKYLVRGNAKAVTEGEVKMFLALCKAQRLNPFVSGEVHLIKYSEGEPAQMVIGYDTYKRRAEENPNFLYKESGIVVQRGQEIIKKEGACLYPTESLIGGWCRVHKVRNDKEVMVYKEVSFMEYNKGKALWKSLPCTMIEKVAVSQALREAFPKDYEGVYTAEEMPPYEPAPDDAINDDPVVVDVIISQADRKKMFAVAQERYGQEEGNNVIKRLLDDYGLESTSGMKYSVYDKIMEELTKPEIVESES